MAVKVAGKLIEITPEFLNAIASMLFVPSLRVTVTRAGQFANAAEEMLAIVLGTTTDLRAVPSKALVPSCIIGPRSTSSRAEQPWK